METNPGNFGDAQHAMVLGAYPKTDDDAAIEALLKTYEAVKPAGETVDGPDIAGLPSRHFVGHGRRLRPRGRHRHLRLQR